MRARIKGLDLQNTVRGPVPGLPFRQTIQPLYDTAVFQPGDHWLEKILFIEPVGHSGKTQAETNMPLSGQLGFPIWARWSYLRLDFEQYSSLDDIRSITGASIQLVTGQCEPVFTAAVSTLRPYLPRGGAQRIKRSIRSGEIKFWPWLEFRMEPLYIDSTTSFHVRIQRRSDSRFFDPLYPVRIKVSLGPYLYRCL